MKRIYCKSLLAFQRLMILMVVLLGMLFLGTTDGNAASYPPLPEALAALESDVEVNVSQVIVPEWPPD